jgi:hypothetical protein
VSDAAKARHEARVSEEYAVSGEYALHGQELIDLAHQLGEDVYDADGRYIGLTYGRIVEMMRELYDLKGTKEELEVLQVRVAGLRRWMNDNLKMSIGDNEDPIGPTIKMVSDVKTLIQSCWPVLHTMWRNARHVLRQVGLM